VQKRIQIYGLPQAERLEVADAENLPFPKDTFDLGYSFGVLHHSPNTERGIEELVRVIRPGGELKLMLYNRHSIYVTSVWIKKALLKGRPWKNLRWVLWNHMESLGTKGYTRNELKSLLSRLPLRHIRIHTELTAADHLSASSFPPLNRCFRAVSRLAAVQYPWRPEHYAARITDQESPSKPAVPQQRPDEVLFTGQRFGFFHCISATKI
jgi:SAM-dependent methyltransferase